MDDRIQVKTGVDSMGRQYSTQIPLSDIYTIKDNRGKVIYSSGVKDENVVIERPKRSEEDLLNSIFRMDIYGR